MKACGLIAPSFDWAVVAIVLTMLLAILLRIIIPL